jgi:hypothetical protein
LLDQKVAIKEIITAGGDPAKVRADVLHEAQAAVKVSNLHHHGVIRMPQPRAVPGGRRSPSVRARSAGPRTGP